MKSHFIELFEKYLDQNSLDSLYRTLDRLEMQIQSDALDLSCTDILLAFGGGKDSVWTLSCIRFVQLKLKEKYNETFKIHIVCFVHPGMVSGVFTNINNVLKCLDVANSSDVKLHFGSLLQTTFNDNDFNQLPEQVINIFRRDVLLLGHFSNGQGRETFCYSCNLFVTMFLAQYVNGLKGEIDYVVSGDSIKEIMQYWGCLQKTLKKLKKPPLEKHERTWGDYFGKLCIVNEEYYNFISPNGSKGNTCFTNIAKTEFKKPKLFTIFKDTDYAFHKHQVFLEHLGFRLREDSFKFTESDCINPMFMSHLRGLYCETHGKSYSEGLHQYIDMAKELMSKKDYSDQMIEKALADYNSLEGIEKKRKEAEKYFFDTYHINNQQCIAMVFSPFLNKCEKLKEFIIKYHPAFVNDIENIKCFIQKEVGCSDIELNESSKERIKRFLEVNIGLSLRDIAFLYKQRQFEFSRDNNIIEIMSIKDPHKKVEIDSNTVSYISGR
ncbi:MAG: hypothetical protein GY797_15205 [Deltaproteobacteria bacterium]|nr:hypothetical protein [Deltaproteobacteria bacterium]